MPSRGAPVDIDLLILFELARGGPGHGPLLLRRFRKRIGDCGFKLHYGTYYPALKRLEKKGYVEWTTQPLPWRWHKSRRPKVYALTEKGTSEARRLSGIFHLIILPQEALA